MNVTDRSRTRGQTGMSAPPSHRSFAVRAPTRDAPTQAARRGEVVHRTGNSRQGHAPRPHTGPSLYWHGQIPLSSIPHRVVDRVRGWTLATRLRRCTASAHPSNRSPSRLSPSGQTAWTRRTSVRVVLRRSQGRRGLRGLPVTSLQGNPALPWTNLTREGCMGPPA